MKKKQTNTIPQCADEYRAEMKKVWGSNARMIDYCVKSTHPYMLPCGRIFAVDVPRIETSFCFGWSTRGEDDYNNACRMEDRARRDADYFIERNMKYAESARLLETMADGLAHPMLRQRYCGRYNCNVFYLVDEGGYWLGEEKKGFIELSPEDKEFILAVLEQEKAMFERRLHAYLKRYGLSKLHTWTYWRGE